MKFVVRLVSIIVIVALISCALPFATFAEGTLPYSDVRIADWFYDGVQFSYSHNLMNGTSNSKFSPNSAMTRAMLVTVLWRYAGSPSGYHPIFSDIGTDSWYSTAVAWASAKNVVNGMGNGSFAPNGKLTREQLASILFRYCKMLGYNTSKQSSLSLFPDGNKVSAWAKDAVSWAIAEKIISGTNIKGQTFIAPQGTASRAQVATILMRFIMNVLKKSTNSSIFYELSGKEFLFCSGAGAWRTVLTIKADGSFYGEFLDTDYNITHICTFVGKFSVVRKINNTSYELHLDSLSYKNPVGYEFYKDGIHYVSEDAYGLDAGTSFILYLPGTSTASLPQGFLSWLVISRWAFSQMPAYLENYGLYNVVGEYGFATK